MHSDTKSECCHMLASLPRGEFALADVELLIARSGVC